LDNAGAAINVFNISAKRAIPNAPVKGQCARDYLYGKENLEAERLLMQLEGHYARVCATLNAGGKLKILSGFDYSSWSNRGELN
jgi:hypothetical protein